jgi:hypothetical protein
VVEGSFTGADLHLDERHAAVAVPHVRHTHLRRHTMQNDELMNPVELVGFAEEIA